MTTTRIHPALVAVTALVFLFLLVPLVIVLGSAFSATSYLTFPPKGLSLRWFANALANATGVRFAHLPFTPDRIFDKLALTK